MEFLPEHREEIWIVRFGRGPKLGSQQERRIVARIKSLEVHERSGDEWSKKFLTRNNDLSIRKSEDLSVARLKGVNRKEVKDFFNSLLKILKYNDLGNKPGQIWNNKPGKVIVAKDAEYVYSLTSSEKVENDYMLQFRGQLFTHPFNFQKRQVRVCLWIRNRHI